MKLFFFLLNSNIYISLAAIFLTIETQVQLGMHPQWHPYLFIIFFATLFEYNLHRLITVITNADALNDEKHKWVKKNPKYLYALVTLSVIGFVTAIVFAKEDVLLTLTPIAIITIFYSLPIIKKTTYLFRLRDIPFVKIILISFVWSSITILLPIIQSGSSYALKHELLLFTERFVFIFAITLPFDIRDMVADKHAGLKTIPLAIGEKNTLVLSNCALLLFMLIAVFHCCMITVSFVLPALLLSGITSLYFVNSKKLRATSFYYYGILDGTILLQGLLVYVFYYLPF